MIKIPAYDYKCKNCGKITEFFHSIKKDHIDEPCPHCGKRRLQKIISPGTGANIIFKGEGFYRSIDYINQKSREEGTLHTDRRKKKESL